MAEDNDQELAKRVFIVFGRNIKARQELTRFLRELGLEPVRWEDLVKRTQSGSPFVGEVLEEAFQAARAVIVLLTGDDQAMLYEQYQNDDDPDYERNLTPQPRQNVLFEAGMAFGKQPKRTILVQIGHVRPFSDVAGRLVVKLTNKVEGRKELKHRLENAGCEVLPRSSDWLAVGNFEF